MSTPSPRVTVEIDQTTIGCKFVPANFTNATYISNEHHFNRISPDYYNEIIHEEDMIDDYVSYQPDSQEEGD